MFPSYHRLRGQIDFRIVPSEISATVADGRAKHAFPAGTTHDYVMGEVKDISDVEVVVDVVAYADADDV